jgi:hypothetical protein
MRLSNSFKSSKENVLPYFPTRSAWANALGKELASIAEVAFSKSYATR